MCPSAVDQRPLVLPAPRAQAACFSYWDIVCVAQVLVFKKAEEGKPTLQGLGLDHPDSQRPLRVQGAPPLILPLSVSPEFRPDLDARKSLREVFFPALSDSRRKPALMGGGRT